MKKLLLSLCILGIVSPSAYAMPDMLNKFTATATEHKWATVGALTFTIGWIANNARARWQETPRFSLTSLKKGSDGDYKQKNRNERYAKRSWFNPLTYLWSPWCLKKATI